MTTWTVRLFRDAISLLCLAYLVYGLIAAPIPRNAKTPTPVPTPPASIVGVWDMRWNGQTAATTFHANGYYECLWMGQQWVGSWVIKDGVLTVRETDAPANAPVNWYVWNVKLDSTGLSGTPDSSPSFSLFPYRPKVAA